MIDIPSSLTRHLTDDLSILIQYITDHCRPRSSTQDPNFLTVTAILLFSFIKTWTNIFSPCCFKMDGKFAYVSCHSSRVKFDIELFRNGKKITTVKTLFISNESHFVKLLDGRFGGLRRQKQTYWEDNRHFAMPPQHWFTFPAKWRQREERSNSKRIRCHFFLLARENFIAAQPIRRTTHRDLGGETSSVWNFRSSCPRRHFTRKSLIALRNPLLFSQATDLDVGAFACNGSKIKLATVLNRQGRVRIRRYDSFFGLTQRTRQNYTASLPQVLTHFNVCDNEQQRRNLL